MAREIVRIVGDKVAYIKNVQPNNTGSTSTSNGSYTAVELNTLEGDQSFVSLNSNQITLSAGTYHWKSSVVCRTGTTGTTFKSKLRNITDSSDVILGLGIRDANPVANGEADSVLTEVLGTFTITSTKVFEFQLRSGGSGTYGVNTNYSESEIFAQVMIKKVA